MYTVLHSVPFYANLPSTILERCLSSPDISRKLQRYPVYTDGPFRYQKGRAWQFSLLYILYTHMLCLLAHSYSEMFEASRWHSDERFFAPMITHKNGDYIFVGDIVNFPEPGHGPCYGKVVKFMTEV